MSINHGQAGSSIQDGVDHALLALDLDRTLEGDWFIHGDERGLNGVDWQQRINPVLVRLLQIVQLLRWRWWQLWAIALDMIRAVAIPAQLRLRICLFVIVIVII